MLIFIELFFKFFMLDQNSPRIFKVGEKQFLWSGPLLQEYRDSEGYLNYKYCYFSNPRRYFDKNNCVANTVNWAGFREKHLKSFTKNNTYRVIFLGDSFTFGEGVFLNDTFVKRVGTLLNEKKINGKDIEIINLGIGGAATKNELEVYYEHARALNPDLILLQWNTNDFAVSKISETHANLITGNYLQSYKIIEPINKSALLTYTWQVVQRKKLSNELISVNKQELELGRHNFYEILEIQKAVSEDNADFVLLIFPELYNLDNYPFSEIINSLSLFAKENNISTIDLLPELKNYEDRVLWVHPTDHHPNELAHEIASKKIYEFIDNTYLG